MSAVLAAGLVFSLTACSTGTSGTDKNGTQGGNSAAGESSGPDGGTAKGRFMEEEIELPEEIRDNGFVDVVQREDGSLEFAIPFAEKTATKYIYDGAAWTKGEAVPVPEGIRPAKMIIGEDGKDYYGGYDDNYVFHVWTQNESGQSEELYADLFKVPEGKSYGLLPDFVSVLKDGQLLVSDSSEAQVFQPDGKRIMAFSQDFMGLDIRIPALVSGNEYLTISNQKIVRYSLESGQQTGSFDLPDKKEDSFREMPLFVGKDGSLYAATSGGLYRTERDGTIWEQIIDGNLNSMGRQDLYMRSFYEGNDGDYYGVFSNSESRMILLHFYYDETVDTVPPETLTVYSLRDNPTVRQAAAVLQKNNPQIRVDFRVAVENSEEEVTEDVIRALNTELLNHKGADVLILDGLPADSYKKKGILADLTPVLADIKGELLSNVVNSSTDQDGKLYAIPARIRVPVIFGDPKAQEALMSIDAMGEYEGTPPLLTPDIYENVLRLTGYLNYTTLFSDDGTIDSETLARWLTSVKSAGEKSQVKVEFSQSEMETLNVNNYVLPDGFGRQGDYNVATDRCAAGVELMDSIDSMMLTYTAVEMKQTKLASAGRLYLPSVTVGINSSSENKEAAEEFIRTLLGSEVQNESLNDGFAVRTGSLDTWIDMEKDISVGLSSGEGIMLSGVWPDEQKRTEIIDFVRIAEIPVVIDQQVLQMVIDGSKDYLEGKETVDQAVQAIENKIKLYRSERE